MACLDTTFLVDLARNTGRRRDRARIKLKALLHEEHRLAVTRFNIAELHVGIHRASDPKQEQAKVDVLLNGMTVLEFDEVAAKLFGQITARLQVAGNPVGDMDVLIAATALASGENQIVTRNVEHFQMIDAIEAVTY